jgi:hypothetical protein
MSNLLLSPIPDLNTHRKMCSLAKRERRCDYQWGVVHPGNALCAAIFRTKREAEAWRRDRASAYVVVKVCITPLYQLECGRK